MQWASFFLIFKWITENMWLVEIKPHPQSPSQYFARQGVVPQRVTDHDWLCNLGHIFQHEKTETKHVIAEKYLRKKRFNCFVNKFLAEIYFIRKYIWHIIHSLGSNIQSLTKYMMKLFFSVSVALFFVLAALSETEFATNIFGAFYRQN